MSQNTLIVSNWKMNFNFLQAQNLAEELNKINYDKKRIINVICPQFLLLPLLNNYLDKNNFVLGSQDFHHQLSGAYTGDTSINLIRDFNCKYSIIGHSERRKNHRETNDQIKKKLKLSFENSIKPILCVGESIDQRENGIYKEHIQKQLFECIGKQINNGLIVAYEPIWSIGTGLTPSTKDIIEITKLIYNFLKNEKIKDFKILYGGSVNSLNFKEIISLEKINGLLIGGASLKIDEMKKILSSC